MKKIFYNKLVRDRIPDKIARSGGDFEIRKLDKDEYEKELLKKAGEEASAIVKIRTREELTRELGDILDVIDEIKKHFKIKEKDLERSRKLEYELKGGFKKRLFLFWTSDTGYRTNERKYRRKGE